MAQEAVQTCTQGGGSIFPRGSCLLAQGQKQTGVPKCVLFFMSPGVQPSPSPRPLGPEEPRPRALSPAPGWCWHGSAQRDPWPPTPWRMAAFREPPLCMLILITGLLPQFPSVFQPLLPPGPETPP